MAEKKGAATERSVRRARPNVNRAPERPESESDAPAIYEVTVADLGGLAERGDLFRLEDMPKPLQDHLEHHLRTGSLRHAPEHAHYFADGGTGGNVAPEAPLSDAALKDRNASARDQMTRALAEGDADEIAAAGAVLDATDAAREALEERELAAADAQGHPLEAAQERSAAAKKAGSR